MEANYRKELKYEELENVLLWRKKPSTTGNLWAMCAEYLFPSENVDRSLPSEDYCELYNKYKIKQLQKKEEEYQIIVSNLPRVYAKNYDIDFTGKQYESLHIEKCVNDHLESKPHFSFSQPIYGQKRKRWHNIIVYKQYKCVCTVCGKEQLITCDRFGIFPPTEYGYHACWGYWSNVFCDCHPISSFQWIVTKLLMDNDVTYQVEYTFDDLYGIHGQSKLRFDFAILNVDGSIKCLIECQGEQHYKPVEEFGGEKQFDEQKKNDLLKRDYVEKHGIKLIEISYKDKAIDKIENILKKNDIIT